MAILRLRTVSSCGSSTVGKASQVSETNRRRILPSRFVDVSRNLSDMSVWMRSLASACQVASSNRRVSTISLCGDGKRPSNTGMAHCM